MWGPPFLADGTSLFPTYRDLGVGIFGVQARWEEIAPTRPENPTEWRDPAYEWPQYLTDSIKEAERYGIEVQLLLMGTPKWANGGRSWNWVPDDPSDFGDFATAISRYYPSVNLWMIWGEPNRGRELHALDPRVRGDRTGRRAHRDPAGGAPQLLRAPRHRLRGAEARGPGEPGDRRQHLHLGGHRQHPPPAVDRVHAVAGRKPAADGHVGAQPVGQPPPGPDPASVAERHDQLPGPRAAGARRSIAPASRATPSSSTSPNGASPPGSRTRTSIRSWTRRRPTSGSARRSRSQSGSASTPSAGSIPRTRIGTRPGC